ncbi:hypothetical protein [Streptomyces sp. AC555_RSS877]|uniref:hypothetical protein n=1 Tax=Streptomyces sp. AC555_RSS877 TaxID=2823688 RepID=UPI001C259D68|nr:hypothetical protein [Streptomyces sp. AC555_RSS877]
MIKLISTLAERTGSGNITWSITTPVNGPRGTAECFGVSLPHGSVDVWSEDNDGLHPFGFRLYGPDGEIVETITTTRILEDERPPIEEYIEDLYEIVNRQVRNVDDLLDSLISDLE